MMIHLAASDSNSKLSNFSTDQVQPNAVDLRIDRVFALTDTPFIISDDDKKHREKREIHPNLDGYFRLAPDVTYEVTFEGIIEMGDDEAGFVITRSTLNRNGLFFTSGLYDSGYKGAMAGALHVSGGMAFIKKGARVAQFLLWKAQALHNYDGSYGISADGTIKPEEVRYHS